MNNYIKHTLLSSIALSSVAYAGEPLTESPFPLATPEVPEYLKLSLNARLRYESRIIQGFDHSDALTFRVRPGLTILPNSKLNFFFETEHSIALAEDFNSTVDPIRANNAVIADPETNEINQAYFQYKDGGFSAKVGRQRIILDNAAFIGNVGWRQNEQTFDAASLSYKGDDFSLYYAYSNQVNRIFGDDAVGTNRQFEGDLHFINASKSFNDLKLTAYGYLLDFDTAVALSSDTYGLAVDYKGLHAEYAYQTDAGDNPTSFDASYAHVTYTHKAGGVTLKGGVEYLEEGFRTPLATVHAFNGFADNFIGGRITGGIADGLTDIYGVASTKLDNGIVLKGFLHYFLDDSIDESYGWEADLVAVKKLTENVTLLGKFSYFVGDDDSSNPFQNDIIQTSVQLDYKF